MGAIKVNKADFFPSGFRINTAGEVLFIDPVAVATEDKADYQFTHDHPDRFSVKDIREIAKTETIFVYPESVEKQLVKYGYQLRKVVPGDKAEPGIGFSYEADTIPEMKYIREVDVVLVSMGGGI